MADPAETRETIRAMLNDEALAQFDALLAELEAAKQETQYAWSCAEDMRRWAQRAEATARIAREKREAANTRADEAEEMLRAAYPAAFDLWKRAEAAEAEVGRLRDALERIKAIAGDDSFTAVGRRAQIAYFAGEALAVHTGTENA